MRFDLYPRAVSIDGTELQLVAKAGVTMTASVAQTQSVAGIASIPAAANDAGAAAAGVAVGGLYRIGNAVQVRLA